jgi:hypothetical protein
MVRLAGAMTQVIVEEYGPEDMLRRLADPWWFQAFGCVLGFDWHSSGVTTVTCGALKEAHRRYGDDLGILVAGGKGGTSRKTPTEITATADRLAISGGDKLVYASRMSAKVDSAAVQDGYQIYAHSFFFTPGGAWCVVQQGMNDQTGYARRYHWLGESVDDFVCEPHAGIQDLAEPEASDTQDRLTVQGTLPILNMVAAEAEANRKASTALVQDNPDKLLRLIESQTEGPTLFAPAHHPVLPSDVNLKRLGQVVSAVHERNPKDFEMLLGTPNVGPATIRSLALIAELIYDAPVSHRDPAKGQPGQVKAGEGPQETRSWADYSYAHGGKDGHPFPVDQMTYDRNIAVLEDAVRKARIGQAEKVEALKRLSAHIN